MSRRRWSVLLAVPALTVATVVPMISAGAADAATQQSVSATRPISRTGTASYTPTPSGSGAYTSHSKELPREPDGAEGAEVPGGGSGAAAQPTGSAPVGSTGGTIRNPRLLRSFDGLNLYQQRTANNGNQFTVEPPDQGLCVGGGHVVEAVNDVLRVYNRDGSGQTGVEALNTFFGYPAEINRTTGVYGPEPTDPSCLYDPTTKTFFLTILTLEADPATGDLTGDNHLDIAVTKNPTGRWNIYRLDVTDDGTNGTPVHPHCPCIGDYPHMGVDSHGFYLTTNEYSFFGPQYNAAQIYAFSKRALARGDSRVLVTQIDTTGADRGKPGFTVWPAQSPSTADYAMAAGGTEYFLSSNAAEEVTGTTAYTSNSIVTWALTNTQSLDWARPQLQLRDNRVGVRRYTLPPLSNQKPGPVPLATCFNNDPCATVILGAPDPYKPEREGPLDSNDTRMQQVTYVNGRLYGALDTAVRVGGEEKAGIAWYIVSPSLTGHSVRGQLMRQGTLGLARNNLIYPAIGLTADGHGVMSFTLVGDDYYPSAAYSAFDGMRGAGGIFIAARGKGPQDGFTEYRAEGVEPGVARPRWGDYTATAVDGDTIWTGVEYIGQRCTYAQWTADMTCGGTRAPLGNWGTRISQIRP